jgi:hypothetical protein
MSLIHLYLAGGIGNQLFQLGFAISLADKFGLGIRLDISSYYNYSYPSEPEVTKLGYGFDVVSSFSLPSNGKAYLLEESSAPSLDQILSLPSDCSVLVVKGYWQSERYLSNNAVSSISTMISHFIKINNPHLLEHYNLQDGDIAVHIRRRDYAHMGLVCEEYYLACLKFLTAKVRAPRIRLFSDEPNYASYFLRKYGYNVLYDNSRLSDFESLMLMSHHKYVIIANSSYSWWGARLNEEVLDKCIIRPDPWVIIAPNVHPCPTRWLSIPNAIEIKSIDQDKVSLMYREFSK